MPRLLLPFLLAAGFARLAAAGSAGVDSCEWGAPARDPFRGDVPGAVDDYTDIPAPTRERLKARMTRFAYDDIVSIRRDAIEGKFRYGPELLGMHFGNRRICGQVTRQSWRPEHEERGLAYCEDGHCVVVPLVCRNVSRIVRQPAVAVMGGPGATPTDPLTFDPPSAGLPAGPAADEPSPTARTLEAPAPTVQRLPPAADIPLVPAPLPPAAETPSTDGPAPPPAIPMPPSETPPVVVTPPTVPAPLPPQEPAPPSLPPMPGMPPLPPAPAIPEPTTWLMWAGGLAVGLLSSARRRLRLKRDLSAPPAGA